MTRRTPRLFALLFALLLVACRPNWQATVRQPDGGSFAAGPQTLHSLASYAEEESGSQVPLERVLVAAGHTSVERLIVVEPGGATHTIDWAAAAKTARWLQNGRVEIDGQVFAVERLEAEPSPLLARVEAQLVDVAPTIAAALGLPAPAEASGRALDAPQAERAALIFLDAFGYVRYQEALEEGLIPNLAALGEPLLGLTVYPPVTNVATPSLLTGAPPAVHGVDRRGIRRTQVETLFDAATAAGRHVVAVEGEALAFNLTGADVRLSGDRDGDGSTDDNVLANALAVIESGMPDLLFVHWHGIDDAGHTYGPGAPEEVAKIKEVDAAVGQLVEALPAGTLIVVVADHGMHLVQEEGRLGNHGHLIERDMFIPILITMKQ